MEQPKIEILNVADNKSFGFKKIKNFNWDEHGRLWCIIVYFIEGEEGGCCDLALYLNSGDNIYYNSHGNLKAKGLESTTNISESEMIDILRDFIRTNHLTANWNNFLKIHMKNNK